GPSDDQGRKGPSPRRAGLRLATGEWATPELGQQVAAPGPRPPVPPPEGVVHPGSAGPRCRPAAAVTSGKPPGPTAPPGCRDPRRQSSPVPPGAGSGCGRPGHSGQKRSGGGRRPTKRNKTDRSAASDRGRGLPEGGGPALRPPRTKAWPPREPT